MAPGARQFVAVSFEEVVPSRYGDGVTGSSKKKAKRRADAAGSARSSEFTPSGVVPRRDGPGSRPHKNSEDPPSFRGLTPYQARLDVEMDDTAVSKVRDPSVSISLGAEHALRDLPRRGWSRDAVASVIIGSLLGALLVVALAILVPLFTR